MITPKEKPCSGCGEMKYIWKNHEGERFCKECWYSKKPVKYPKQKSIKPVSDKKRVEDVLYSKMRKDFLEKAENATCRAKLPGICLNVTGLNLTIHHTKGRGKYYLDTSTWIPLCLSCHSYVETHPKEAREMGLSDTKRF